jgi:hypothetical protein
MAQALLDEDAVPGTGCVGVDRGEGDRPDDASHSETLAKFKKYPPKPAI